MPILPSSRRRRMVRSERTTRRFYEGCGKVHPPVSMLFPPIDPNERFRERRAATRRRKRLRRALLTGTLLVGVLLLGGGARFVGGATTAPDANSGETTLAAMEAAGPRPLPVEIR